MRVHCAVALATLLAIGISPMATQAQQRLPSSSPDRQDLPEHASGADGATNRTAQPSTSQPGAAQRGTNQAGVTPNIGESDQQNSEALANFYAAKMVLTNQAEIEAANMVSDKLQNSQVKQFAQSLIEDHRQLNQRLTRAMPQVASMQALQGDSRTAQRGNTSSPNASTPGSTQPGTQPQATTPGQDDHTGTPIARDETPTNQLGQDDDRTSTPDFNQPDRIASDRGTASPHATGYRGDSLNEGPLGKMLEICREAKQNELQMSQQMMQSKQGKDLDMTFVGTQIVCHQQALAELRALDGVGSSEFQQIVQQAEQVIERHYQEAQELARTLGSDDGSSQSQRGSDPRSSIDRR